MRSYWPVSILSRREISQFFLDIFPVKKSSHWWCKWKHSDATTPIGFACGLIEQLAAAHKFGGQGRIVGGGSGWKIQTLSALYFSLSLSLVDNRAHSPAVKNAVADAAAMKSHWAIHISCQRAAGARGWKAPANGGGWTAPTGWRATSCSCKCYLHMPLLERLHPGARISISGPTGNPVKSREDQQETKSYLCVGPPWGPCVILHRPKLNDERNQSAFGIRFIKDCFKWLNGSKMQRLLTNHLKPFRSYLHNSRNKKRNRI